MDTDTTAYQPTRGERKRKNKRRLRCQVHLVTTENMQEDVKKLINWNHIVGGALRLHYYLTRLT